MLKPIVKPPISIALYVTLFILTLLLAVQLARSIVMVSMDMEASAAGTMQINWRDNASQFSEFKSKKMRVSPGRQTYFCIFLTLAEVDEIRINPINTPANIILNNLVIRRLGYEQAIFDTDKHFQAFKPGAALTDFKSAHNQLRLRTLGNHAQFEFAVQHPQINTQNTALIDLINLKLGFIALALLITLGFAYPLLHLPLLLISMVGALVYFSPFAANYAAINVTLQSAQNNQLAVYWAAEHQAYSEQQARHIDTQAGSHAYRLGMGDLKGIQHIRIDPLTATGKVLIEQIEISAFGYDPIVLNAKNQFRSIDFSKNPHLKITGDSLAFTADNADAFFEFSVEAETFKIHQTIELYYCLLALLGFMTLLFYVVKLKYPAFDKTLAGINIRVGVIIISMMLMQCFWSNVHDFYVDLFNIKILFLLIALGLVAGFFYTSAQVYLLYFVVFVAIFFNTQLKQQHATITLDLQTPVNSEVAVYWANKFEAYQENKVARIKTHAGDNLIRLDLASLKEIYSIRINPLASKGQVSIKAISLSDLGYDPICLEAKNNFYAVDFKHTNAVKVSGDSLVFDAKDADAFFEMQLNTDGFKATNTLKAYLGFLGLLTLINLGGRCLKKSYPAYTNTITQHSLKIGGIIIAVMLLQWIFSADYGFFIDYQANELVITTAGELAQQAILNTPDTINSNNIVHIGLLNLAYGVIVILALLLVGIFSKLENAVYLAVFILLCTGIAYVIKDKNTLIHIEMDSSIENRLKVYWADEAEIYREQHSASVNTQTGSHRYTLSMANFNNIHNIRIEPLNAAGRATISKIEINEIGYQPIILDASNHFYAVDPIEKSKATNKAMTERLGFEQDKLVYVATDEDAFFELIVQPDAFKANYPVSFYLQFMALLGGIWVCLYTANYKFGYFQRDSAIITLRVCWVLVAVMIVQMAWLSDYDAHPDEKAHIDSIEYYTQYWKPPVVGDQRALNTYQYPWGVSRLDDLGISYLLMGKLKNLMTRFAEDTVFTCRVFNSLLIALLLLGSSHKRFTVYLIPLLCLPQIWHLFSYANRDGFALWLAILLGWQVANKDSSLYRYLNAKTGLVQWRNILLPMVLLGLLSIELTNYIIYILYVVAILIWQGLCLKTQRKQFLIRCLVLVLLAGSIYGVRKAGDIYLNGFDKQAQKIAYAEAIAAPDFKPSVAATDKGYFGLRLQQKGVDALTLFEPRWEWQVLTFKSFAGTYGNQVAEYSPEWYYSFVTYLYSLIALIWLVTTFSYGDRKAWVLTAITILFVMGDLLMGFLYSWTYDFQPQGRYIFPLIPMLMVYIFKMAPLWGDKVKALLLSSALLLFVLGLFSFRLIALKYLLS
ncbi:MAG: hypothetical protein HOP02_02180 [Methylococcaceae bacterium]|nr:hypothetical protein [Methylococcaceae bacterium]